MVSYYGRITMLKVWKGPGLTMNGAPHWYLLLALFMPMNLGTESVALRLSSEQCLVFSMAIESVDDLLHHPSLW